MLVGSDTQLNFYRFSLIITTKYLRIFIVIFVILSAIVGLSIQGVNQPESTTSGIPEIVEAGGKIIEVNISDGVEGISRNG